jgi:hypothetical protein
MEIGHAVTALLKARSYFSSMLDHGKHREEQHPQSG